jgi:AcrR family transcriptional regulator
MRVRTTSKRTIAPAASRLHVVTESRESPRRNASAQRHRQPDKTRAALIDAAARIFNSAGFDGTDSNRIAREAGYAPGTFYVHFPDKLTIFLEVYRNWVNAEWSSIEEILKSGGAARTLARRLNRAVVEHHRKWRTFRASLRSLSATEPRVHDARVASRARQIDTMTQLIRARHTPLPSRARMLSQLLFAESLCDAIAEGDAASLGIHDEELLKLLDENSRDLLDN